MTEQEAYQEHIRYTHDTYCRIVIRHASFDAARMLAARWTCPNNRPTYPTQCASAGSERQNFLHFFYFFIAYQQSLRV